MPYELGSLQEVALSAQQNRAKQYVPAVDEFHRPSRNHSQDSRRESERPPTEHTRQNRSAVPNSLHLSGTSSDSCWPLLSNDEESLTTHAVTVLPVRLVSIYLGARSPSVCILNSKSGNVMAADCPRTGKEKSDAPTLETHTTGASSFIEIPSNPKLPSVATISNFHFGPA
jgi:hypothetical protein